MEHSISGKACMVVNGQKGFIVGTMGSWNLYEE